MSYRETFRSKINQEPIKQRLRLLQFRCQRINYSFKLRRNKNKLSRAAKKSIVPIPAVLQPPPYKYRDYQGPWIEDFFYEFWANNYHRGSLTYLPIFFDGFFLHSQTHKYSPQEFDKIFSKMRDVLTSINEKEGYFTILGMYDFPIWEWHKFPKNILVFSAAGGGDIPIPLLNGSPSFQCPAKEILVSFMGSLSGASNRGNVRQRMYDHLNGFAHFGQGPHWRDVMAKSTFTLCPRGLTPASFRLYEALSLGSIPIYIWDDVEWLPYKDVIDWSEIAISVNVRDIEQIPDLIKAYSNEDIAKKQARIAELYPKFFTFEATCENILRIQRAYKNVEDIYKLTKARGF